MTGEAVMVKVSLSGRSGRKEMTMTNEARFTFETSKQLGTQQASLPGNITLMFKNGSCSDTESTDFKGKNLACSEIQTLINLHKLLKQVGFLYIFQ